jgi:hypothetical protein
MRLFRRPAVKLYRLVPDRQDIFQLLEDWQFSQRNGRLLQAVDQKSLFWLIRFILYVGAGLCRIVPLFTAVDGVIVDATGRLRQARDLRETAVIVMMATMLATSVLALLRWFEGLRRCERIEDCSRSTRQVLQAAHRPRAAIFANDCPSVVRITLNLLQNSSAAQSVTSAGYPGRTGAVSRRARPPYIVLPDG